MRFTIEIDTDALSGRDRRLLCASPFATGDILRHLSQDYMLREIIASNECCPVDLLEQLAQDKSAGVRANVARNVNTPTHVLSYLGRDRVSKVQMWVATNLNTDVDTLTLLAEDEGMRRCVVYNINTPAPLLLSIFAASDAEDWDEDPRDKVIGHPNLTLEHLHSLLEREDLNSWHRERILERLEDADLLDVLGDE